MESEKIEEPGETGGKFGCSKIVSGMRPSGIDVVKQIFVVLCSGSVPEKHNCTSVSPIDFKKILFQFPKILLQDTR